MALERGKGLGFILVWTLGTTRACLYAADGITLFLRMSGIDEPRNPEAWFATAGVCGSCVAWRPMDTPADELVALGSCRLRPELRRVPASLEKCPKYNQRGGFTYKPSSVAAPATRRKKAAPATVKRRNEAGELVDVSPPAKPLRKRVSTSSSTRTETRSTPEVESYATYVPPPPPKYRPFPSEEVPKELDLGGLSSPLVASALRELLSEEVGHRRRDMAGKFRHGGKVVAMSDSGGDVRSVQAHAFFAWLERLAKTLDALEEAVDTHPKLHEESEEMLTQLRRMRGSFTTLNVLFADREDYFSGKA